MAEPNSPGEAANELPTPTVVKRGRFSPSLIWIVPLVAAISGLTLVAKSYHAAGPRITVSFQTAEGIEPDKTEVRYKEVVIGKVRGVELSDDHTRVLVHIHLDKRAADFAAEDTRFWVVRPRVSVGGVSGLTTLFSGTYLGADAGTSKQTKDEFTGLETPPGVLRGNKGRSFALRSDDLGSLDIGSPVYYRRLVAGRITAYKLNDDGKTVSVQLFVDAPYDRFVTGSTHFWNASGVDVTLNASGLKVNTESLATVIAGGVAFQSTNAADAQEAAENTAFNLYADVGEAMKPADGPALDIRMRFNETLRGLAVDSPVDFRGVVIGTVKSIDLDYDPDTQTFPANVTATIYPQRLGGIYDRFAQATDGKVDVGAVFKKLIDNGFRAQLRLGNLLTQQLYVAIALVPKAKPVAFDAAARPLEIPTAPGSLEEIQQQVADILAKLDKVPFDEIGTNLRDTLHNTNALVHRLDTELTPQAKQMLEAAQHALESANRSLSADSPLQHGMTGTLEELRRAAQSLRGLADYLQRHPEALLRGKSADPSLDKAAPPKSGGN
jgi:paraquat-inducible protein B